MPLTTEDKALVAVPQANGKGDTDAQAVLDLADKARRHGRTILYLCVAGALCGALYTFLVPARWMGKTRIFVTLPEQMPAAAQSLSAIVGGPQNPYAGALAGILGSHRTMSAVSEATGIELDKLKRVMDIELVKEQSQIVVSLEHRDKETALNGLRTAVRRMRHLGMNLDISKASREARELTKAVAQAKQQLETAQRKLLAFQRLARTVPDPEKPFMSVVYVKQYQELKSELGAVATELRAAKELAKQTGRVSVDVPTASATAEVARKELARKRLELAQAEALFSEDSPEVQNLRRQLAQIRGQVELEVRNYLTAVDSRTDPSIAQLEAKRQVLAWQVADAERYARSAPSEAVEYQTLMGDVKVASDLYNKLRQQYEQAKVESDIEKIRWTVLDPPYIEPKPVNKSYPRNIALGLLSGMLVSVAVVYFSRSRA